jgi:hypothetical protein
LADQRRRDQLVADATARVSVLEAQLEKVRACAYAITFAHKYHLTFIFFDTYYYPVRSTCTAQGPRPRG